MKDKMYISEEQIEVYIKDSNSKEFFVGTSIYLDGDSNLISYPSIPSYILSIGGALKDLLYKDKNARENIIKVLKGKEYFEVIIKGTNIISFKCVTKGDVVLNSSETSYEFSVEVIVYN